MSQPLPSVIVQAGAVPFRWNGDKLEVLLITNSAGTRWQVPKGWVDAGMTPQEAGAQEAWEEAGVRGKVHPHSIGFWTYRKRGLSHRVELFPMHVSSVADKFPEQDERARMWRPLEEAMAKIADENLRLLVGNLPVFLSIHGMQPGACA